MTAPAAALVRRSHLLLHKAIVHAINKNLITEDEEGGCLLWSPILLGTNNAKSPLPAVVFGTGSLPVAYVLKEMYEYDYAAAVGAFGWEGPSPEARFLDDAVRGADYDTASGQALIRQAHRRCERSGLACVHPLHNTFVPPPPATELPPSTQQAAASPGDRRRYREEVEEELTQIFRKRSRGELSLSNNSIATLLRDKYGTGTTGFHVSNKWKKFSGLTASQSDTQLGHSQAEPRARSNPIVPSQTD